jgi:hypothetical protein
LAWLKARGRAAILCGLSALGPGCSSERSSGVVDAGDDVDAGAQVTRPEPDPTPPATIGGVTPSRAFLARHQEVLIHGSASSWGPTTQVDLGPGITVTNLSVPASDLIAVDFGVDRSAALGPRDVTVLDADGGTVVGAGALTIASPIAVAFDGTLAQGSIVVAHVTVVDPSIPLDTTFTQDPFGNETFTNLAPVLPAGFSATVLTATTSEADVEIFIDEATTGTGDFDLVSGPPQAAGDTDFPLPSAFSVAARAPIALLPGTPASASIDAKYGTALFAYTPPSAALAILDFSASSTASAADPAVILLPASGAWVDQLTGGALSTWLSASTDPIYAVYFDDTGTTGAYSVGLTATTPAASAAASASDATQAGAVMAAGLPFVLTGGQLTSASSTDWIQLSTGPGDADKHLEVQSAGDPRTFLDVTIYLADGITSIGGNESGGPVHARTGPLAASTTYYVVFSAGAGFDPSHGAYAGILRLE